MAPRLATITRRQEGILLGVSRSYNPPQGQLRDVATSVFCLQDRQGLNFMAGVFVWDMKSGHYLIRIKY